MCLQSTERAKRRRKDATIQAKEQLRSKVYATISGYVLLQLEICYWNSFFFTHLIESRSFFEEISWMKELLKSRYGRQSSIHHSPSCLGLPKHSLSWQHHVAKDKTARRPEHHGLGWCTEENCAVWELGDAHASAWGAAGNSASKKAPILSATPITAQ